MINFKMSRKARAKAALNRVLDVIFAPILRNMTDPEYFEGGTRLEMTKRFILLRCTPRGRKELAQVTAEYAAWLATPAR